MGGSNNSFNCPNLICLWTGETSCQWSTTSWQSGSERRTAVGQEWFQVAGQRVSVKDLTVTETVFQLNILINHSSIFFTHFSVQGCRQLFPSSSCHFVIKHITSLSQGQKHIFYTWLRSHFSENNEISSKYQYLAQKGQKLVFSTLFLCCNSAAW